MRRAPPRRPPRRPPSARRRDARRPPGWHSCVLTKGLALLTSSPCSRAVPWTCRRTRQAHGVQVRGLRPPPQPPLARPRPPIQPATAPRSSRCSRRCRLSWCWPERVCAAKGTQVSCFLVRFEREGLCVLTDVLFYWSLLIMPPEELLCYLEPLRPTGSLNAAPASSGRVARAPSPSIAACLEASRARAAHRPLMCGTPLDAPCDGDHDSHLNRITPTSHAREMAE